MKCGVWEIMKKLGLSLTDFAQMMSNGAVNENKCHKGNNRYGEKKYMHFCTCLLRYL